MGNLFDIANIRRQRSVYSVRQERIKREGSPYYSWNVPVTATTATAVIYVPDQFRDSRKYQPLDWLEIVNNEAANDLYVTINNSSGLTVPAKTIRTIDNLAIWHLAVRNDGLVNTTLGLIRITLQKQPLTIDQWARGRNGQQ